eukprot:jgi/Mesvir1/20320/Mv19910-RA.1
MSSRNGGPPMPARPGDPSQEARPSSEYPGAAGLSSQPAACPTSVSRSSAVPSGMPLQPVPCPATPSGHPAAASSHTHSSGMSSTHSHDRRGLGHGPHGELCLHTHPPVGAPSELSGTPMAISQDVGAGAGGSSGTGGPQGGLVRCCDKCYESFVDAVGPLYRDASVRDNLELLSETLDSLSGGGNGIISESAIPRPLDQQHLPGSSDQGVQYRCDVWGPAYAHVMGAYITRLQASVGQLLASRSTALDWICLESSHRGFCESTTWAAVHLLDRFLAERELEEEEAWAIQLSALGCLWIAAKFYELQVPPLDALLKDSADILEAEFEPQDVKRVELMVLAAVDWRVWAVTPYSFVDRLIAIAAQTLADPVPLVEADEVAYRLSAKAFDVLRCCLYCVDLTRFTPTVLAAATVLHALAEPYVVNMSRGRGLDERQWAELMCPDRGNHAMNAEADSGQWPPPSHAARMPGAPATMGEQPSPDRRPAGAERDSSYMQTAGGYLAQNGHCVLPEGASAGQQLFPSPPNRPASSGSGSGGRDNAALPGGDPMVSSSGPRAASYTGPPEAAEAAAASKHHPHHHPHHHHHHHHHMHHRSVPIAAMGGMVHEGEGGEDRGAQGACGRHERELPPDRHSFESSSGHSHDRQSHDRHSQDLTLQGRTVQERTLQERTVHEGLAQERRPRERHSPGGAAGGGRAGRVVFDLF